MQAAAGAASGAPPLLPPPPQVLSRLRPAAHAASRRRCHQAGAAPATAVITAPPQQSPQQPQPKTMFAGVSASRGFLPDLDPLDAYGDSPPALAEHERALAEVPMLAMGAPGKLRRALLDLPPLDLAALDVGSGVSLAQLVDAEDLPPAGACYSAAKKLGDDAAAAAAASLTTTTNSAAAWRAYAVLSFLAHSYLWCDGGGLVGDGNNAGSTPLVLPAALARPWATVSCALGMPPVLVYSSYALSNWRRLDPTQPIELGNLACIDNFFGGQDEQWFKAVHVAIEAALGPAVAALPALQKAAADDDAQELESGLLRAAAALRSAATILGRMQERCEPSAFFHRVRGPTRGWRGNDALPRGLVYESLWRDEPQQLYGATGAQCSSIAAMDIALGVDRSGGSSGGKAAAAAAAGDSAWLQVYLRDQRLHMPPAHRRFVAQLELRKGDVRGAVKRLVASPASGGAAVADAYDEALQALEGFRGRHRAFSKTYIADFVATATAGAGGGGGGISRCPFFSALRKGVGVGGGGISGGGAGVGGDGGGAPRGTGGTNFIAALSAYKQATSAARSLV